MSLRGQSQGKTKQQNNLNKSLLKSIGNDYSSNRENNVNIDSSKNNQFKDTNLSNKINFQKSKRIHQNFLSTQQEFKRTVGKLYSANFQHHDPNLCVCDNCLCGRHLCKLHSITPVMSKGTVYQQSFVKKNVVPNIVPRAGEAPKNEGPHLDINSIQRKDYSGIKGDETSRPKPQDLLKVGGPSPALTTYGSVFPGYKCDNQYVKPTDKHVRGNFPLQARTTYGSSFGKNGGKAASLEKTPDSLKHGAMWLGKTTYGSFFKNPNPQDYANKVKIQQKLQSNPNYTHQYETVYRNDFLKTGSTVCPSKVLLESKIKGMMSKSKGNFAQNMDYKALSPDYHALSLAKQSFI